MFGTSASDIEIPLENTLLLDPSTAGIIPTPWQNNRIASDTFSGDSSSTFPTSLILMKLTLSLALCVNTWLRASACLTHSELPPTTDKISQLKYSDSQSNYQHCSHTCLNFFLIESIKSFLFINESRYSCRFLGKIFSVCFTKLVCTLDWCLNAAQFWNCWSYWGIHLMYDQENGQSCAEQGISLTLWYSSPE